MDVVGGVEAAVVAGAAEDDGTMVTPALAQYWTPKAWAAKDFLVRIYGMLLRGRVDVPAASVALQEVPTHPV